MFILQNQTGAVPSIIELEKRISMRIVNAHQSMSYSRPMMTPGLTYIAGIHIRPPKQLPADVQVLSQKKITKNLS